MPTHGQFHNVGKASSFSNIGTSESHWIEKMTSDFYSPCSNIQKTAENG